MNGDLKVFAGQQSKGLSPVPLWLAIGVILGFFVALLCVFLFGVPDNGGEVLMIMVGTLTSLTTQIVSYYFGSSAGSKSKEEALINRAPPAPEPVEIVGDNHG